MHRDCTFRGSRNEIRADGLIFATNKGLNDKNEY